MCTHPQPHTCTYWCCIYKLQQSVENEELVSVTWIFLSTLTSNNLSHYSPRHQRGQTHQQLNWLIVCVCVCVCVLIKMPAPYKSHLLLQWFNAAFDQFRGLFFLCSLLYRIPSCISAFPHVSILFGVGLSASSLWNLSSYFLLTHCLSDTFW